MGDGLVRHHRLLMTAGLDEIYARSYVPATFTVAGLTLPPLTLGHAIALEVLGQRELADHDRAGLLLALEVCRRPPADFWRRVRRPHVRLGLALRAAWLARRRGPAWWLEQVTAFRAYCTYYSQMPSLRHSADATPAAAGAPFLEHVLVCLMARLHYPEADALRLPLSSALLRYCTHWEIEGRLELASEGQETLAADLMQQADAEHAATLAKVNATLSPSDLC